MLALEWWEFLWRDWYVSHKTWGNMYPFLDPREEFMIACLKRNLMEYTWGKDGCNFHLILVLWSLGGYRRVLHFFPLYVENYRNYWNTTKPDTTWSGICYVSWFSNRNNHDHILPDQTRNISGESPHCKHSVKQHKMALPSLFVLPFPALEYLTSKEWEHRGGNQFIFLSQVQVPQVTISLLWWGWENFWFGHDLGF